jgi:hypothetical protein
MDRKATPDRFAETRKGSLINGAMSMLKLNAGFRRKVGEPNYGSRGATVTIEVELDSGLIREPDALRRQVQDLFDLARRSVDAELRGAAADGLPAPAVDRSASGHRPEQLLPQGATASQRATIRAMCGERWLAPDQVARERFGRRGVDELTVREASLLITSLMSTSGNGRHASRW